MPTHRRPNPEADKKLAERLLGDPEILPDSFKSWLLNYVLNAISDSAISAAAGIQLTKLDWHVGSSPPSTPVSGTLWIYTGATFYWMFVYDPSEATYVWKFVG